MITGQDPTRADNERPQPVRMGENHRRRINASLGMIDDLLQKLEAYVAGAEAAGVLRHVRNDLSADQRKTLGQLRERLRSLLTELQRDLGLAGQQRTVTTVLQAQLGIVWETVAGLTPRHLQAWGNTVPEFDAYWEPRRQMLEELLDEMFEAIGERETR